MSHQDQFVPYTHIIEALKKHCAVKDSGTLFITTQANAAVRFVLNSGKIISMAQSRERGIVALDAIRSMQNGRFKFSKEVAYSVDGAQQLPTTQELITLLLNVPDNVPVFAEPEIQKKAPEVVENITSVSVENASDPKTSVTISKETVRKVIEFELIEEIGPMGSVVCDEHLESIKEYSERSVIEQLIRNIAIEIDSDSFRLAVETRLLG